MAQGHANVWAVEMGSKQENGNFEAFVAGFDQVALTGDTHHCTYESPSLGTMKFGWTCPLTVNGKEIEIHNYKRYDNEACQAEFDTDCIEIHCDGHMAVLDFKNVQRTVD